MSHVLSVTMPITLIQCYLLNCRLNILQHILYLQCFDPGHPEHHQQRGNQRHSTAKNERRGGSKSAPAAHALPQHTGDERSGKRQQPNYGVVSAVSRSTHVFRHQVCHQRIGGTVGEPVIQTISRVQHPHLPPALRRSESEPAGVETSI